MGGVYRAGSGLDRVRVKDRDMLAATMNASSDDAWVKHT